MPSLTNSHNSNSFFASRAFRLAAFCVIAILLIGGGIGIWLETQPQSENRIALFNGKQFMPDELVQIEAALAKKNLSDYTIVNQTLEVPVKNRGVYVAALAESNALPQESGRTLEKVAVDISLFDSPEVRNLKIKAAQQKDLADIINSIDGISNATALWDVEKQGGLNPKTIVRASISLKSDPNCELGADKINAIRRLASNAIAGLKPENVVVVDTRTGICYSLAEETPGLASEEAVLEAPERIKDPALSKRLTAERFWNKKIADLVRASVENAIVRTTVELSDCQSETQRRIEHDPEPTIYRSEIIEDMSPAAFGINEPENVDTPLPKLRQMSAHNPGVESPNPPIASSPVTIRKTEEGVLGGKETLTTKIPLAEKCVRVSVVIPMESVIKLCRQRDLVGCEPRSTDAQVIEQMATVIRENIISIIANILPQQEAKQEPEQFIRVSFTELNNSECGIRNAELSQSDAQLPELAISNEQLAIDAQPKTSRTLREASPSQQPSAAPGSPELAIDAQRSNNSELNSLLPTPYSLFPFLTVLLFAYWYELLIIGTAVFGSMTLFGLLVYLLSRRARTKSTRPDQTIVNKRQPSEESRAPDHKKVADEPVSPISHVSAAESLLEEPTLSGESDSILGRGRRPQKGGGYPALGEVMSAEQPSSDSDFNPEFAFLQDVPAPTIAQVLSVERPQAAALALSQMSNQKAAQTLACFSADYSAQVAKRIARLETPAPEIIADFADSLKGRIKSFSEEKANRDNLAENAFDGIDKLSKIISFADVQAGREILESINQKDKSVLEPLYPVGVTFDDIANLDVESIKTIFDAANPNEAALALVGAEKDVINKLLTALPENEQQKYRSQLWLLGPTKLSDVEESRKRMVRLTLDLAVQGRVKLPSRFYSVAT